MARKSNPRCLAATGNEEEITLFWNKKTPVENYRGMKANAEPTRMVPGIGGV